MKTCKGEKLGPFKKLIWWRRQHLSFVENFIIHNTVAARQCVHQPPVSRLATWRRRGRGRVAGGRVPLALLPHRLHRPLRASQLRYEQQGMWFFNYLVHLVRKCLVMLLDIKIYNLRQSIEKYWISFVGGGHFIFLRTTKTWLYSVSAGINKKTSLFFFTTLSFK